MFRLKDLFRTVVMFIVGFCAYITIEVLYRGYSYPLMGTMGGVVFILIDQINEKYSWNVELSYQAILGGIYATITELIYGLIDKEYLHLNMWNYQDEYFNFYGIVCLKFSIYWCLLALLAVLVADFINYCLYRHSRVPYYIIFGHIWVPKIYQLLDDYDIECEEEEYDEEYEEK